MDAKQTCTKIRERFGDAVLADAEFRGEHSLTVNPAQLRDMALFCRDELQFDYLVDAASVDHFGEDPRFEVVYELYSLPHGIHLRLKYRTGEDDPRGPTLSDIWPTADWHEREIWDMMGIRFDNHPDLRRILMWEGYPYHPLRKDFPLEGKPSDTPEVAFTEPAPLAGGPFVTTPTTGTTRVREPRARRPGELPTADTAEAET